MATLGSHLISAFDFEADATNSVSGAQDASLVNSPSFVSALIGSGMDCEADNESYAEIANADAAEWQFGTNHRTVEVWCRPESLPPSGQGAGLAWMGSTNSADTGWHIIYNNSGGTGQFAARLASGSVLYTATASGYPADGSDYHVVASYNRAGNLELFVNNIRATTTDISAASAVDIASNDDVKFGGEHGTQAFFDGIIDAVRLYDYALGNHLAAIDYLWNNGDGRSTATILAATTIGARTRENFGALTPGTGTPAGFTALGSTNTVFEVVTDAGSEGGQALEIQKSGAGDTRLVLDAIGGKTQTDVVIEAEVSGSGLDIGVIICSTGASGSQTEYLLRLSGTALTISEVTSGSLTIRTTASSVIGSALTSGTVYALRFRRHENILYGRVWIPASEVEPSGWDATFTDNSPRGSGSAGVAFVSSSGTLTVHYISVATGNDAGCVLPDDDLPSAGVYLASQTDSSVRVLSEDGSTHVLVAILGTGATPNLQGLAVHQGDQTVFTCLRDLGRIVRVDRYGLNQATINDTITNPFGIDIDEANDLLYISDRTALEFYTDDIAGGAEASLFTTTGSPGYVSFDGTYIWYSEGAEIYRRNADGTSPTSYGSLANPLTAISDGTTMVGGWFQTNTGIRSKPVASPGDSFASVDTVTVQALAINGDGSETWGSNASGDLVYHWSDFPPTTANRTTIASIDAPKGLGWFEFVTGVTVDAAAADGAEFSDTAASTLLKLATALDGVTLTDAATVATVLASAAADGLSLSDVAAVVAMYTASGTDGLEMSDAATALFVLSTTATDGLRFSDAAAASLVLYATATDGLRMTDAAVFPTGAAYVAATVTIANAIAASVSLQNAINATVTLKPD